MIKLKRSQCSILPLVLKGKWYDMIATGEKKEEYRANTQYWAKRLYNWMMNPPFGGYLVVAFSRGYRKPDLFIKAGDYLRTSRCLHPAWGEPKDSHFVIILHGRVQLVDGKKGGAK